MFADGHKIGEQKVRLCGPRVAFKITTLQDELQTFEAHAWRFLQHTELDAIQWINVSRERLMLRTLLRGDEELTKRWGTKREESRCLTSAFTSHFTPTKSNSAFVDESFGSPRFSLILVWLVSFAPKTVTGRPASFRTAPRRWA